MSVSSGIPGLDAILHGGFQKGRTMLVEGGPGSGKTVLGMHFLAAQSEPALMLSFEESPAKLVANAETMTFAFAQMAGKSIHIVDGRPPTDTVAIGNFDLQGLIVTLDMLVQRHGIACVVIDAIDGLFSLSEDRSRVRAETLRLLEWLNSSELTALLTMKTRPASGYFMDEFDFAEFSFDGVLQLKSTMYGKLVQRTARILKRRGAPFIAGEHAYTIGARGLQVLDSPIRTFISPEGVSEERCSSGVVRLDRMLRGGFLRGSTTLFSGLPGSSKTTFSAAFLSAGCAAGERGLFIGFDEPAEQMIRNVQSVGIDLDPHIHAGLLHVESFAAGAAIADEFVVMVEDMIAQYRPDRVVLDAISALTKAGGIDIAEATIERLVNSLKLKGLTAVVTTLSEPSANFAEKTPSRVSTVADTWIHLSFASHGGERNRTLTVVKSRGTGHSTQTREVMLSERGITLADVYAYKGSVLFGTARLEREQALRAERFEETRKIQSELKQIDDEGLALERRAQLVAEQIARLTRRRAELADHVETVLRDAAADTAAIQSQRRADPDFPAPSS